MAKFRDGLIDEIIRDFDRLPDDAVIPTAATERLLNISKKTVRRHFTMVRISLGRVGQRVGEVRAIAREAKATPPDAAA